MSKPQQYSAIGDPCTAEGYYEPIRRHENDNGESKPMRDGPATTAPPARRART